MLYPSIDKLLNIVDSKYMLVHVASRRAKQMLDNNHYQMNERDYVNKKPLGKALEEVEKGLIQIQVGKEQPFISRNLTKNACNKNNFMVTLICS